MTMPSYSNAEPKKRRSILTIVLVVVLITVALALVLQYRETTKAVDNRDAFKVALQHSKTALATAQDDLKATKTQVTGALNEVEHYRTMSDEKDIQLTACGLVVKVSDHEQRMALLAMQASSDYSNSYYGAALTKYNAIEDHVNAVQAILDANGYNDTGDLYEDCDPTTTVL